MIATNCVARGLDFPNVQHVIHYQVPTTGEDYVHRSGRTARASTEGLSILLMEPNEVKNFVKLQKTLGRSEYLKNIKFNMILILYYFRRRSSVIPYRLQNFTCS